jgi:hypothetical protein
MAHCVYGHFLHPPCLLRFVSRAQHRLHVFFSLFLVGSSLWLVNARVSEWIDALFFFLLRWIPVFTFGERGSEDLDYRGDFRNIYIRYVEGDFPLYNRVGGWGYKRDD